MRILLFTGKGGVGKTTVAAATAVRAAEAGLRTIVCLDRSGPLARRRVRRPARRPADADRATACGASSSTRACASRRPGTTCARYLVDVLDWVGADAVEAEELAVDPRPRRGVRARRHQGSSRRAATTTSSSSTARRRRRRSGCSRCPTCSAGTWTASSTTQRRLTRLARPILQRVVEHSDRRRPGVRRGPPFLRPARRRARAAHRRRHHERAPRREPRTARGRGSAPHVHVPFVVRLPRRRGDREPHPAERARPPVARAVESDAVGAPRR